eukprot:14760158-Alexandrium_andersonii.AAC.1
MCIRDRDSSAPPTAAPSSALPAAAATKTCASCPSPVEAEDERCATCSIVADIQLALLHRYRDISAAEREDAQACLGVARSL